MYWLIKPCISCINLPFGDSVMHLDSKVILVVSSKNQGTKTIHQDPKVTSIMYYAKTICLTSSPTRSHHHHPKINNNNTLEVDHFQ